MNDITNKIRRRIQKSVLKYGVPATIGRCLAWPLMYACWKGVEWSPAERRRRRAGVEFDRKHNVDTTRTRSAEWAADVKSENWAEGEGYEATPPDTVRRSIGRLQIAHEDYTFIDLGSGKARVPLVAAEFPFKSCLGVEYAPDLHATAVRNIDSYRNDKQRCRVIKSICDDAASFPLPETPLHIRSVRPS